MTTETPMRERPPAGFNERAARTGPWFALTARIALAVVWCWAGWAKIQDPAASPYALRAYRVLPESLVDPVGYGIPALELTLALLLLAGLRVRLGGTLSALLLLGFLAAIVSAWARGLSIDCGCFGGGGEVDPGDTQYVQEVLRDLGLLLPSGLLIRWPASRFSLDARL
ncbi:DoxX family protein [Streptomyces sp. JUS-F4]|uniref:MauE/DoxX family redox-associated membrane protein n=1 Tax=Streptomyces TaxID=1883 RepID=UPI001F1F2542|nr:MULTISPECIES: MauE/DoxX family redox-associated membrane protein [Streptomyces]WKN12764.1 DoxX family protein [Streptomyces sp. JUS-F4]WKN19263.1 DoxX family protein [Streptomyces sp. JUS-F4]